MAKVKPSIRLLFLTGFLATFAMQTISAAAAGPYSAYQINSAVPNAESTFIQEEQACQNRLEAQYSSGLTPRNTVNASGPYALNTWLSPAGKPTATSVMVSPGTKTVNLQFNQMQFICDIIVHNNSGTDSDTTPQFSASKVTSQKGHYPNDRAPNPETVPVNAASLWQVDTKIEGAAAKDAGGASLSVSGNYPTSFAIQRDPASRYWFAQPIGFSVTNTSGFTKSETAIVTFTYKTANTYHNYPPAGTSQCNNANGPVVTLSSISQIETCQLHSISLPITIDVQQASCGYSTFPASMVIGQKQAFNVGITLTYPYTGSPQDPKMFVEITGPDNKSVKITPETSPSLNPYPLSSPYVEYNAGYPTAGTKLDTAAFGNSNGKPAYTQSLTFTPQLAGQYTLRWGMQGSSLNVTCGYGLANGGGNPIGQAGSVPYFNVLGGDVAAGPGFGACSPPSTPAGIFGSNKDTTGSGPFYGAGTQLGAFALSNITSFATSQNVDGSDAGAGVGTGLAFANSTASGKTYGGSYGKGGWCSPDYADNAAIHATATPSSGSVTIGSLPNGVTYVKGDTTISGSLSAGQRITLVVNGNVFISSNVTYGSYATIADIPQFRLLVIGGNVYMGNTVSELHGFYDAQPSGANGGTIYTCASVASGSFTALDGTDANAYADCNHPLAIYGSLAAKTLKFGRTYGSLVAAGGVPSAPAEQIIYTPELWLSNLSGPSDSCTLPDAGISGCAYQGFTGLPPVL